MPEVNCKEAGATVEIFISPVSVIVFVPPTLTRVYVPSAVGIPEIVIDFAVASLVATKPAGKLVTVTSVAAPPHL